MSRCMPEIDFSRNYAYSKAGVNFFKFYNLCKQLACSECWSKHDPQICDLS